MMHFDRREMKSSVNKVLCYFVQIIFSIEEYLPLSIIGPSCLHGMCIKIVVPPSFYLKQKNK